MQSLANPRKKPRQQRSEATVEAILQAAARILVQQGLSALNTNAIADLAGVSVGSLYQYFPNKTAIMVALIRRKRARLVDGLRQAAEAPAEDLTAALDALITATIRHQMGWPELSQALDRAEVFLPLAEETAALNRELGGLVAGVLARHGIAASPPMVADVLALCRGMIDGALMRDDLEDLPRRVGAALRGYLALQ
ncbi:TetR/AcrR family transcriptional regulator [Shimia sediminis]|uniref:TetR/AcrR family transcriptional regulator n=1 Tax=Shimia sediminis TaxID=2497945 RepID=UPI0013E0CBDE|nr:TetR/AcrR family transcriptional regulator [Shimia sediminis]